MKTHFKSHRPWTKWQHELRKWVVIIAPPTPVDIDRVAYEAGWRDAMAFIANYMGVRAEKCDGRFETLDDIRSTPSTDPAKENNDA